MAKVSVKAKIAEKFGAVNKTKNLKITLSGQNSKNKKTTITIPVNPEKIAFESSGKFQEYNIINKGTVKFPNGNELSTVGWESFLPGESLKGQKFIVKYKDPHELRAQIRYWEKHGKKIRLTVSTTPINISVYIDSYKESYEGSNGNIYYSIAFVDAVDIDVDTVKKKKKGKTSGTRRTSKRSGSKTYTVKKGDTLWDISKKFYKDATKWKKIYSANKSTIEKAAKKHKKKSSNKGHWIFPGTKLKIP